MRGSERDDTTGVAKGLEPFIYSFKSDTLALYFNEYVTFRLDETFKTIVVCYISLRQKDFNIIRQKSYNNDGYYSVPAYEKNDYPASMPKPKVEKNK